MNSSANPSPPSESLFLRSALIIGALIGLMVALFFWSDQLSLPGFLSFPESALLSDLKAFVSATLATDPMLIFIGLGFFVFYCLVSTVARSKNHPTGKLLALFKSTGFSVSLALVAAKLPAILEKELTAAAAIAPVYHTLGWITFAVAAACILELVRESVLILTTKNDS